MRYSTGLLLCAAFFTGFTYTGGAFAAEPTKTQSIEALHSATIAPAAPTSSVVTTPAATDAPMDISEDITAKAESAPPAVPAAPAAPTAPAVAAPTALVPPSAPAVKVEPIKAAAPPAAPTDAKPETKAKPVAATPAKPAPKKAAAKKKKPAAATEASATPPKMDKADDVLLDNATSAPAIYKTQQRNLAAPPSAPNFIRTAEPPVRAPAPENASEQRSAAAPRASTLPAIEPAASAEVLPVETQKEVPPAATQPKSGESKAEISVENWLSNQLNHPVEMKQPTSGNN